MSRLKLDKDVIASIKRAKEIGMTDIAAANLVDVSPRMLWDWLNIGRRGYSHCGDHLSDKKRQLCEELVLAYEEGVATRDFMRVQKRKALLEKAEAEIDEFNEQALSLLLKLAIEGTSKTESSWFEETEDEGQDGKQRTVNKKVVKSGPTVGELLKVLERTSKSVFAETFFIRHSIDLTPEMVAAIGKHATKEERAAFKAASSLAEQRVAVQRVISRMKGEGLVDESSDA